MGKSKGSTVTSTAPDAQTSDYMRQLWGAAQKAGAAPGAEMDPRIGQASDAYTGAVGAGGLGLRALSGDQSAYAQLANPYQASVLDAIKRQFGDVRDATMSSVNDAATRAGAFGGSRHGVAEGIALRGVAQDQNAQMADVTSRGYGDAMARAGGLANFGMAGAQGLAGLGQYSRQVAMENDPAQRQLAAYLQAMGAMPHGTTSTQVQTPGHNGATGALGGAATGAEIGSMFGPWGTGIGAGIGGLLGIFG